MVGVEMIHLCTLIVSIEMMVTIIKMFSTESVDDELTNECVSCEEFGNVFCNICKSSRLLLHDNKCMLINTIIALKEKDYIEQYYKSANKLLVKLSTLA